MATSAHILLPWPPTGNHSVKHTNSGQHYRTKQYKQYRLDVAVRVVAAGLHRHPLEGRLKVTVHACPPDKRRRDLHDNVPKTLMDSIRAAGVMHDDSQIKDFRILEVAATPGTCNVFIETLEY